MKKCMLIVIGLIAMSYGASIVAAAQVVKDREEHIDQQIKNIKDHMKRAEDDCKNAKGDAKQGVCAVSHAKVVEKKAMITELEAQKKSLRQATYAIPKNKEALDREIKATQDQLRTMKSETMQNHKACMMQSKQNKSKVCLTPCEKSAGVDALEVRLKALQDERNKMNKHPKKEMEKQHTKKQTRLKNGKPMQTAASKWDNTTRTEATQE
jgi:hypothetical protein